MQKLLSLFLVCSLFAGCAANSQVVERRVRAERLAEMVGFQELLVDAAPFKLTAYARLSQPGKPINIYIEGDGYAWVTRNRISHDPTPRQPVALQLASEDPAPNVVYLARPCQFTPQEMNSACEETYWTGMRFSEEVIGAMNQAVDKFMKEAQSTEVHLIGYSGGATVAVLVAARRKDVKSIRTVAGNLDPAGLNEYHEVSPQDPRSLDPLEVAVKLRDIPQYHFLGMGDQVVPALVTENFVRKTAPNACVHAVKVKGIDHKKGWVNAWPGLLALPLDCSGK